jgi:isoquinoline 1-oxidoreductase alpha subunit
VRIGFALNEQPVLVDCPPCKSLLAVLREDLGLAEPREGCGRGLCGFCLVFLEEDLVSACLTPVFRVAGHQVTTIERMRQEKLFADLEAALEGLAGEGPCRDAVLMSVFALLGQIDRLTYEDYVDAMAGTICPEAGYPQIYDRIQNLGGARSRRWQRS